MCRVSDFKEHLEAVWSLFGGRLLCSVWAVKRVIHSTLIVSIFLTNTSDKLQGSGRGQNGVEFRQEFNGHGPKHVTCVFNVPWDQSYLT